MRVLLLALFGLAVAEKDVGGSINKVIGLLKDLKATIQDEGAAEAKMHEERVASQKDRLDQLGDNIEDETRREAKASAEAKAANADVEAHATAVADLSAAIAAAETKIAEATEANKARKADFEAKDKELSEAIDMLARAKTILKRSLSQAQLKEVKSSMMQVASTLDMIIKASSISDKSKDQITAMLQGPSDDDGLSLLQMGQPFGQPEAKNYESKSGGIVDAIAELEADAKAQRAELRKENMKAGHAYEMLKQSEEDGLKIDNRDLKENKKQQAERTEDAAREAQVASEQQGAKAADEAEVKELQETMTLEQNEFDQVQKERAEEIAAIEKAIEILSGIGNKDMFVQLAAADADTRAKVAALLQGEANKFKSRALAQLASRTRVGNDTFAKIRGMIEDMIAKLEKQADDEATHNSWCIDNKKENEEKKAALQDKIDAKKAHFDRTVAHIAQLKEEIATLSDEVAASKAAMAAATKQRKEQNDQFQKDTAEYKEGMDGLTKALQVLSDFYNKGYSSSKSDAQESIMGILETALTDLTEMDSAAREAEDSQAKAYTKLSNDTEVSVATKTALIESKNSELTTAQTTKSDHSEDLAALDDELKTVMDTGKVIREKCTHKPQTFEERAAKMQAEIAGLKQALDILNNETAGGEEFLQKRAITKHM